MTQHGGVAYKNTHGSTVATTEKAKDTEKIKRRWRMHVCFGFYLDFYLVRSAWIVYAGLILDRYDQ